MNEPSKMSDGSKLICGAAGQAEAGPARITSWGFPLHLISF